MESFPTYFAGAEEGNESNKPLKNLKVVDSILWRKLGKVGALNETHFVN
jgi:hypothetical protein